MIILCSVIIVLSVVLDQLSKWIVVTHLMPIGTHPFINGLIRFTYVENTGAAFGMMKGHRWLFLSVSSIAIVVMIIILFAKRKTMKKTEAVLLSFIIGGGIGNQIDRFAVGYVVDFIEFEFVDFAVFNIADSFITVGCILLLLYVIFADLIPKKGPKPQECEELAESVVTEDDSEVSPEPQYTAEKSENEDDNDGEITQ